MGYYSGIVEHDTGIHADADQTVSGQGMLMVNITLSEYRELVSASAKGAYDLRAEKERSKTYKQELYDALKDINEVAKLSELQNKRFLELHSDYEVKK